MPVEIYHTSNSMTAAISGEIDHHSAAGMRMIIDGELGRTMPELLTFDLSDVTFMDSSGIGLILGRAREMQPWGGKVKIFEPSERINKILKLSGLGSLIVKKPVPKAERSRNNAQRQ